MYDYKRNCIPPFSTSVSMENTFAFRKSVDLQMLGMEG
jgi:hypothetical protein